MSTHSESRQSKWVSQTHTPVHKASQTQVYSVFPFLSLCLIQMCDNTVLFCFLQRDGDIHEDFVAEQRTDDNRK